MSTAEILLKDFEYLGPVRIADLIAKTSRTSLKDAIRVLIAADTVSKTFDLPFARMVPTDYYFDRSRLPADRVSAIEQAYTVVRTYDSNLGTRGGLHVIDHFRNIR